MRAHRRGAVGWSLRVPHAASWCGCRCGQHACTLAAILIRVAIAPALSNMASVAAALSTGIPGFTDGWSLLKPLRRVRQSVEVRSEMECGVFVFNRACAHWGMCVSAGRLCKHTQESALGNLLTPPFRALLFVPLHVRRTSALNTVLSLTQCSFLAARRPCSANATTDSPHVPSITGAHTLWATLLGASKHEVSRSHPSGLWQRRCTQAGEDCSCPR